MKRRNAIKNLGFLGLSIFLAPRLLIAAKKVLPFPDGQLCYFDGFPIIEHESPLGKLYISHQDPEVLVNFNHQMFKALKYGKTTIGSWDEFFESNYKKGCKYEIHI